MTWLTLIIFGIAIALWRHGQHLTDEISKVLAFSFSLISLVIGLAIAPIPLKGLGLLILLACPICTLSHQIFTADCPRYCRLRYQCQPQHKPFHHNPQSSELLNLAN
jgi:hypothetical protein